MNNPRDGLFLALFFAVAGIIPAVAAPMEDRPVAVLRTIDKISARTGTFEIPVDKTVKFGSGLFIKARACRASAPMDKTESAAFLQIWERGPDNGESKWVFSGWMFASRPSVSAMEHPIYDVWLIDCKNAGETAKTENFAAENAPAQEPEKAAKPLVRPFQKKPEKKEEAEPPVSASPLSAPPTPGARPSLDELNATPSFESSFPEGEASDGESAVATPEAGR